MKPANDTSKGNEKQPPASSLVTENPGAKNPRDARHDEARLKKNRKELGVEEDHKTDKMEKSKRGTFP